MVEVRSAEEVEDKVEEVDVNAGVVEVISEQQRQDWTAVNHEMEESEAGVKAKIEFKEDSSVGSREEEDRHVADSTKHKDNKVAGDVSDGEASNDVDLDGEALEEEDLDGEALGDEELDGEALEEDDLQC